MRRRQKDGAVERDGEGMAMSQVMLSSSCRRTILPSSSSLPSSCRHRDRRRVLPPLRAYEDTLSSPSATRTTPSHHHRHRDRRRVLPPLRAYDDTLSSPSATRTTPSHHRHRDRRRVLPPLRAYDDTLSSPSATRTTPSVV